MSQLGADAPMSYRVVMAGALLVVLASVACPLSAAAATSPSGVRKLSTTAHYKEQAEASGNLIVWEDYRRGEHNVDVWGYDLSTGVEFAVSAKDRQQREPAVSGGTVVWQDSRTGDAWSDIYGYDRATGAEFLVAGDGNDSLASPRIDGDTVVWEDRGGAGGGDIYGKNLETGATFTVCADPGRQSSPDIAGEWVVYVDKESREEGSENIKAYNLTTKETHTVCGSAGMQYHPRVSSTGLITWQDEGGATSKDPMNIRGRWATGGDIRTLASGSGTQHNNSNGLNHVIYHDDNAPGGYPIVGYDVLSGTRFGIAYPSGYVVYQSSAKDGTLAWIASTESMSRSYVYVAHPTDLDVLPETATELTVHESEDAFPNGSEELVLATSGDWHDAAAAAALAGTSAPLLITSGTALSAAAAAEITRLKPTSVTVVGSTSAISTAVQAQVAAAVPSARIERIAGSSWVQTSWRAARRASEQDKWDGTVLVCSSNSYTSAVIAAPVAARKGYPLIYVGSDGLAVSEARLLRRWGAKRVVVVGGGVPDTASLILQWVFGVGNVRHIKGTTSSETSARFASWAVSSAGMRWNKMGIASASNWTRGIAAATAKGRDGGVVLLTNGSKLSSSAGASIQTHQAAIRSADFIGSSSILSKDVRRQVRLIVR